MNEPDKSKIDNLRDILYSRKVKIRPNFVLDLNSHDNDVQEKWTEESIQPETQEDDNHTSNLPKKIFWGAFAFFLISLGVALYVYFNGGNVISANNIKIDIIGPTSIKAGEETILDVSVTNYNDITLEVADLVLEYPKGTRSAVDKETPMTHDRVPFGDIGPNQTVRRTIKSVMFGEEGKPARIDMSLEYRIPSAMSVFTKDASYEVMIGSAPLTLSIQGLKEVNANQDYELLLEVVSNSAEVVKDVVVTGELPFGFEPTVFSPQPLPKSYTWDLGDIESSGKRIINIKGKMYGDHNEERYFKFSVGTKDEADVRQVNGIIASVMQPVAIKEPFLGLTLAFGQGKGSEQYTARSGTSIPGTIEIINNLDVPIYDTSIELKLNGAIVLFDTIKPSDGFYDSNTRLVKWNKFYNPALESFTPKTKQNVTFLFGTDLETTLNTLKLTNPEIIFDLTVRGKRRLENGVPEEIVSTIHRAVKVVSNTHLYSRIVHTVGPIENEGSIPPQVGKKTEYTVIWNMTNNFNELSNTKVTAILPDYVTWTNIVSAEGEKLNYNPDSRVVTWDLGAMKTSLNGKLASRQVAFQIAFTPSRSQIETMPILINVAKFTARDTFTGTDIDGEIDSLTTDIQQDPAYSYGAGTVTN